MKKKTVKSRFDHFLLFLKNRVAMNYYKHSAVVVRIHSLCVQGVLLINITAAALLFIK